MLASGSPVVTVSATVPAMQLTQLYRKKPVLVEAVRWDGTAESASPIIDWILAGGGTARYHDPLPPQLHSVLCRCDGRGIVPGRYTAVPCPETEPKGPGIPAHLAIDTLEGTMAAMPGDWIVRGTQGEFYPCKPAAFSDSFETVWPDARRDPVGDTGSVDR